MPETPDELAAGLQELAERELPPAGERFEGGLRQAVRWEQRRRRTQRRWLVTVGCLTALCAALAVALALPVFARHLPVPVGGELRRLDSQTSDLQARLAAQASLQSSLLSQLSLRDGRSDRGRGPLVTRHRRATRPSTVVPAPNGWSAGWAWVRPTVSPSLSAARPAEASPLGSSPSSSSPSSTPTPTPTATLTPTPSSTSP